MRQLNFAFMAGTPLWSTKNRNFPSYLSEEPTYKSHPVVLSFETHFFSPFSSVFSTPFLKLRRLSSVHIYKLCPGRRGSSNILRLFLSYPVQYTYLGISRVCLWTLLFMQFTQWWISHAFTSWSFSSLRHCSSPCSGISLLCLDTCLMYSEHHHSRFLNSLPHVAIFSSFQSNRYKISHISSAIYCHFYLQISSPSEQVPQEFIERTFRGILPKIC